MPKAKWSGSGLITRNTEVRKIYFSRVGMLNEHAKPGRYHGAMFHPQLNIGNPCLLSLPWSQVALLV